MPDPYMEAMMRGDFSKKKKDAEEAAPTVKTRYQVAIEKNIQQILDLFKYEDGGDLKLITPEMKRAKLEQELSEAFKNVELSNYIDVAVTTLVDEGKGYLEPAVFEQMISDFSEAVDYLNRLDLENLPEEDIGQILHIHAETLEAAFEIALTKFEEEQYDKSLALLVFLTLLQAHDEDYWYKLGIVAQYEEKYELALRAYENTATLTPDHIGAKLFAAECFLMLNRKDEAKDAFEEIKKIHKVQPLDSKWLGVYEHLNHRL